MNFAINEQIHHAGKVSHEFNAQHMYAVCITLSHRVVLKYVVCATAPDVHVPDIPENYGETRWRSGLRREHEKINCQLTWVQAPPLLCLH